MDIKKSWDTEDWITNVRNILDWASNISSNSSLMLILRHSHRETLRNHQDMASAGITELGRQVAVEVGKRIRPGRPMDIYTSFIPRCHETAEGIADGYSENGGEVIDISPLPTLVAPQILDHDVWNDLHPNGENVTDYVNRWVDGEFENRIEPFEDYRVRFMADTIERLISAKEPIIFIHITHDLALLSAKRMLLERALKFEDREPYLGGLGVAKVDTGLELFISSMNRSVSMSR
ncbi:MAG: histidine phosphatase family protein [Candidatus Thorarchaeota archaeon]